jgi:lipoprotein-releasing system ATP-binding protein
MISCKDIEKSYGNVKVLKGVSMEVKMGEMVAITGKSGAGKSTLLHILGTLDLPDAGLVLFEDQNITDLGGDALAKFRNEKIGFVFQFHHLLPEFTALENVMIPGYIGKKNPDALQRKAQDLLEFVGLGDRIHHKPNELSGGEQQRVAIARALINDPLLILADEPTGNLDTKTSEEIHQLLLGLKAQFNPAIVLVTHNPTLANLCDSNYHMKDGQIERREINPQ